MARTTPVIVATIMRPEGETGVQTHFNAFAAYLAARGDHCRVVTPFDLPRALVVPTFGVRRVLDRLSGPASVWWYRFWHALLLWAALRLRLRGDEVIYAQCPLSAAAALRARRSAQQRVCMVVHFNVSQADEWAEKGKIAPGGTLYRGIQALEAQVLPRLDALVYVSAFMRERLQERIPALAQVPSAVIPNFVRAPQAESQPMDARQAADLISIGTLEPRKNQAYLLRVLAAAKASGRQYSLTLVGDGPDRATLEGLCARLGLAGQVRFLGRVLHAASLLETHRVYAHAARMESQGIVLLEALSYGLPLLAAPVGGIPEVFSDGVEGFFWPLDDAEAAARYLIELLEDDTLRARMSANARSRFREAFDEPKVAGRLAAFLTG